MEVEVDVHHTPVGRTSSGNYSRNEAMLSSSPSSSQSSPESSSGSNSSSPLPSIESPSSSMNKASQPSSNNNVPSISPTGNRFSSVEDGRSSPAISGSAQGKPLKHSLHFQNNNGQDSEKLEHLLKNLETILQKG